MGLMPCGALFFLRHPYLDVSCLEAMHAHYLLEQGKTGHILGKQIGSLKGEATCNWMLVQAASDSDVAIQLSLYFGRLQNHCYALAPLGVRVRAVLLTQ